MKLDYDPGPMPDIPVEEPPEWLKSPDSVSTVSTVRTVSKVGEAVSTVSNRQQPVSNRPPNVTISDMVELFLESGEGRFTTNDVNAAACAYNRNDKNTVYQKLTRLKNANRIRQVEGKYGAWEPVIDDFKEVNFDEEDATPVKLTLPLGLSDMVEIRRGDLILIQGETNTGKTALMMAILDQMLTAAHNPISLTRYRDVRDMNSKDKPYRYLFTEGKKEFKKRMESFDTRPVQEWTKLCAFIERRNLWHQLTLPNGITFIDYLEVDEDFFEAGKFLNQIHAVLDDGIAFVAVQKNPDKDWGVGGPQIMAKPRLVLNLEDRGGKKSRMVLKKVKHAVNYNTKPQGLHIDFVVTPDCRIESDSTHWKRTQPKARFKK